ncbi:MAG: 50S ribosomal protein L24 [Candidatus Andersenbacteria bacterium]|nr:50S ribosomal protein L24 [Candidatus Andersenbacteria bacterium]MBI3251051.1 50S ribosomal protein L24 [Candidatus Andersenbacteria bacterium]
MPKLKIKSGDTVKVLRGRDRGKTGKVLSVIPKEEKVIVEGANMVHRHIRPRRAGEKGQRVIVASATRISNVMLVCPKCKKASRVGLKREGGVRQRICKNCEAVID